MFNLNDKYTRTNGKFILSGIQAIVKLSLLQKELDKRKKLSQNIFLVPGIQTFPTPLEEHSIDEIYDLIKKERPNIGYNN